MVKLFKMQVQTSEWLSYAFSGLVISIIVTTSPNVSS